MLIVTESKLLLFQRSLNFARRVMYRLSGVVIYLFTTAIFLVAGEVRIFVDGETQKHLQRELGSRIDITCNATDGSPTAWRYEDETNAGADDRHHDDLLSSGGRLTILDAQFNDSGVYRCSNGHENDYIRISVVTHDFPDLLYTQQEFRVEIVSPPEDVLTVDAGSSFTLRCVGHTGSSLGWFHNGTRLRRSHRVVITSSREIFSHRRQVSLLTRNAVHDQTAGGRYECRDVLTQLGDGVTVQVHLNRKSKVPVEIIEPASKLYRVRTGRGFEIKCRASNASDLIWLFNGSRLHGDNSRNSVLILNAMDRAAQQATSTLLATAATKTHSGKYACFDRNEPEDDDYVMIIVVDDEETDSGLSFENGVAPIVPTPVIMQVGSITNLQCSFQAPGVYHLQWTKDDQILTNGEKYIIYEDSDTVSLHIRFTDRSDVGVYKCTFIHISSNKTAGVVVFNVATIACPLLQAPHNGHLVRCPPRPVFGESCSFACNRGYHINSSSRPAVCERNQSGETYWSKEMPECTANPMIADKSRIPTTTSHVLLRIGSSLTLHCFGTTVWTKHNRAIENNTKYTIDQNSLTINNTDLTDAGVYDCGFHKDGLLVGVNKFNVTSLACPKRPLLPNGVVEGCSQNPLFGESCSFRCDAGYALHGNRFRSCELVGNETVPYWTGDQTECLGPAEQLFSNKNSATSSHIPAKLCIFGNFIVFRLDQQRILSVVISSSAVLLIPHFSH